MPVLRRSLPCVVVLFSIVAVAGLNPVPIICKPLEPGGHARSTRFISSGMRSQ